MASTRKYCNHVCDKCDQDENQKHRVLFDIIDHMKDLAIITVIYKNYTVLDGYLESIDKQKDTNFKLFIVDLTEEPQDLEQVLSRHPELVSGSPVLLHSQNKGYAHGINVGLIQAQKEGYERFCVMNTDTFFESNFVSSIQDFINEHPGAIGGGKIYYASGYEYHKGRYEKDQLGKVIWFAGGEIDWKNVFTKHVGVDEIDNGQFDSEKAVDFLTGCCMFFDKSVFEKVGMFDESYFLYYEDADWCVRATKGGVKLIYDPKVVLWHKNAQSTDGAGSSIHIKYQEKNRVKFGLKYAPLRAKLHLLKNLFTSPHQER